MVPDKLGLSMMPKVSSHLTAAPQFATEPLKKSKLELIQIHLILLTVLTLMRKQVDHRQIDKPQWIIIRVENK